MSAQPCSPLTERRFEVAFAGAAATIPAVRHFTRLALAGLPATVVDDAVLCVDELAANAIEHTRSRGSQYRVVVAATTAGVHVEVIDEGADQAPAVTFNAATHTEHGRGLLICSALGDLGCAAAPNGGRRIWVDLPIPSAAPNGAAHHVGGGGH